MTPERRDELRRAEDAVKHARYTLDRKNYMVTIAGQDERIKALESLLCEAGADLMWMAIVVQITSENDLTETLETIRKIDAILPKTEEVKDGL